MKYILPLLVCILSFVSCTKDSEFSAPDEFIKAPVKNAYRAVRISGTNTHWGNFTLNLKYGKEELEQGILTNEKNDTIGGITISRNKDSYEYDIMDFIPNVDNDSINRLKAKLDDKYGAGSYNLWDSIPKVSRTVLSALVVPTTGGLVKKIVTKSYRPNENSNAKGEDFDNTYVLVTTKTHIYEFNLDSYICVDRMIQDTHNPKDQDLYKRSIAKNEIDYAGDRIQAMTSFIAKSGASYSELERFEYSYDTDCIINIVSENLNRKFTYAGNQVNVSDGANTLVIELDGHGNVIAYNDGQGNSYKVEYEEGHGNLSLFVPMDERMKNPYYIK